MTHEESSPIEEVIAKEIELSTSPLALGVRLVLTQFVLALAGLLIFLAVIAIDTLTGTPVFPDAFMGVTILTLFVGDALMSGLILLEAARAHYFIQPEKIIIRTGISSFHEEEHEISAMNTIDVSQSLMGRILNYGNVQIKIGKVVPHEEIELVDIPEPERYADLLRRQKEELTHK